MSIKSLILNYILEDVVPFGGGTEKWRWTVHRKDEDENTSAEEAESHTDHTQVVSLPSDKKMREQHITKLMSQYSDKLKEKFPNAEHATNNHPSTPQGRNHGSHWVDDGDKMHSYSHHFEKID